ncbi:unnamed protein product [Larinioides sclopetarius]|uniref:Uncharacterized protein n=1 Tax=Larinioides sclopetarius TaxID=280406 RepID=A0AAV2A7B8_9ARAC
MLFITNSTIIIYGSTIFKFEVGSNINIFLTLLRVHQNLCTQK